MYDTSEVLFVLTAFVASVLSGSVGFGSSLVLLPVSALLLPVKKAIALVVVFFLANNITKIAMFFRHINWKMARLQWYLGIPFVITGALLMVYASAEIIQRLLGLAVLAFVANQYFEFGAHKELKDWEIAGFGGLNGFLGGLVGAASVLRAAVFTHIGLKKESFVATLAVSGFLIDIVKVGIYGKHELISVSDTGLIVGLCAAAFLGTFIGKRILEKLHPDRFKQVVLVIMAIIGLKLLFF